MQPRRSPFRFAVFLALTLLASWAAFAGQTVNLEWDASNDPTVVGYYIYYGPSSGVYTNRLDAGNGLSITTPALPDGAYYFSATSRTAQGVESEFVTAVNSNILTQPPAITLQPVGATISAGSNAVISVGTSGAFLSYFWMKNGTALADGGSVSGATSANLTIANASVLDSATYSVIVSNKLGVANSSNAVLAVYNKPVINAQPQPASLFVGLSATFSVSATSDTPLSFQWQKNGADILSATTSSYTIPGVRTTDAGTYRCILRNSAPDPVASSLALLTVMPDITAPHAITTWPKVNSTVVNGQKCINGSFTTFAPTVPLSGSVTDNGVITNVTVTRTVPPWAPLTFSPTLIGPVSSKVWTNLVTLVDGSNTFQIIATDSAGLTSTVLRTIFLRTTNRLTVVTNGYGSTVPAGNLTFGAARDGASLQIGRNYSIKAVPKLNNWFVNWTDRSGSVLGTNVMLTFRMTNNLSLTANFVTNGIIAHQLAGTYNGLFAEQDAVLAQSAGAVSTLAVSATRALSGKLVIAGATYLFSGTFDAAGKFAKTIARKGKASVIVSLQLDLTTGKKQVSGNVSCPADGWTSPLRADVAYYSAKVINPMAGRYTMAIPPLGTNTVDAPIGYGYGLITNSPTGTVNLTGALADLTALNYNAPLSQNGDWPVCIDLYAHQGLLHGWINFSNGAPVGSLSWVKPAQPPATNMVSKLYPAGVSSVINVFGSAYRPATPVVTLSENSLELDLPSGNPAAYSVAVTNNNAIVSPVHISGTVVTTTGLVTLTLPSTVVGGVSRTAYGVVLQSSNAAVGTVSGTNAAVYLH